MGNARPGESGGNDWLIVVRGRCNGSALVVDVEERAGSASSFRHAPQSPAMNADGGIHLDVVVTDASGKPVAGLQQGDFSLLDDGKPQKIVSFTAFDGVKSKPDPPVEVILVIDALNNSFVEMGFILQALEKYLRENGGQL